VCFHFEIGEKKYPVATVLTKLTTGDFGTVLVGIIICDENVIRRHI
jgi:hypothetical protein